MRLLFFLALILSIFASEVVVLTDDNFKEKISSGKWFVKFYTEGCSFCKLLAPIWKKLAVQSWIEQLPIHIAEINCADSASTCSMYNVRAFPTLLLLGELRGSYTSADRSVEALLTFVKSNLSQGSNEYIAFYGQKHSDGEGGELSGGSATCDTSCATKEKGVLKKWETILAKVLGSRVALYIYICLGFLLLLNFIMTVVKWRSQKKEMERMQEEMWEAKEKKKNQ